ncbi:MarR family winged helix-turn-helix transcriptional regulator [Clostridium tarantellae]|uniref:MarR family transcriptional regulator n=1 Tax=Clostridium tarantellae TaxID=39493 RepID=A0A6I1MXF1_9CLOT|nr:MarR family transcriptional regulator [Clostridium tarantellae]MPQ44829.1 MarR family transcriptional regulator [Clostridium tarantellae]
MIKINQNVNCECLGKYISMLYRQGRVFLSKEFNTLGIGSGQYLFLLQLYRKDGVTQEELSESLLIDKGTTARAISKLEEEGFVNKVKDENDKRSNKIYLTEKAKENKQNVFDILNRWENVLIKDLTDEEKDIVKKVLRKIVQSI